MKVGLYNVKKVHGERVVLDIDKLNFDSGKIYAVLGPNGSGKTTMLRIIAGIDELYSGKITYNNNEEFPVNEVSYMPQKPYMFDVSVLKNVLLGLGKKKADFSEAEKALEFVSMKDFSNARAVSLSGGEAQRVALARTLVLGRKLVLLDEPASAADMPGTRLIEEYIKNSCREYDSTVIFSTHSPSQALKIADELIFLWNGRVVESGKTAIVLESPQSDEVREFLMNWRI
jgi:ABC-type Fe3+/spermidine/putrescine transport system ATPase subunit